MKAHSYLAIAFAVVLGALSGCQTQAPATRNGSLTNDPTKKVYTQSDLNDSGRVSAGRALQQLDPDINRAGGQ
jgi:hypothetical protein